MSAANKETVAAVVAALKPAFDAQLKDMTDTMVVIKEKSASLVTPNPGQPANIIPGGQTSESQPYSVTRIAGRSIGMLSDDECKYELEVSDRLKDLYAGVFKGFAKAQGRGSFLVPMSSEALHYAAVHSGRDKDLSMVKELNHRLKSFQSDQISPDEVAWTRGRMRQKAANTLSDTDGGVLRGFPTLGDIIEIQRNLEVFPRCGCTQVSLPPNGMLTLPKQTGNTTSYYEGEAYPLTTASQPKYGVLDLTAKKQYVRTEITNDAMRFITPSIEAITRTDMAAQAALTKDLKMLEGPSGTKAPRGITTFKQPGSALTRWVQGVDYLLEYTGSGYNGTTGSIFRPEDLYKMISVLPDVVQQSDNLKFIGRFDMYAALANRRGDAVATGDGNGQFVFNMMRELNDRARMNLNGSPYIGSSQISATRGFASTPTTPGTCTYLMVGDFTNWVDASFGVAEFLATNVSDTAFDNDTTKLRMIAYNDGGPRHASSFAIYDNLLIQ